ncbi:GTPase IMAP family member 8-like isoform X2 [Siniperca chuatsi]|uniref:GTPase IMAP family member 8-like isoform X2 n=1 Tax=Siniperca chuatsi TaxID=119488 RepID=UPI001CE21103|nr:GTPase IMAP family member 8-like isoform X2 [Siniperca chuatsi]
MATAAPEPDVEPVKRSSSFEFLSPNMSDVRHMMYSSSKSNSSDDEFLKSDLSDVEPVMLGSSLGVLPPDMSELRVVLLGNSWSQSSSVGNFILGETKFNTEEEPDCCQRERGRFKEKEIVLINTPDLLFPSISEDKLREHVTNCVRLSDPGPHVFLLVLQPEDFTEELKLRLCRVLKLFSDRSFDHSLVLISTPREESPGFMDKYMNHPPLKDMIRKCHDRFLWRKNLELAELLTRLGQIVRENNEQHLSLPREPDVEPVKRSSSFEFLPPDMSELRVVLLGNSWSQSSSVGNFILGETKFSTEEEPDCCQRERGQLKEKEIVLINTPDLLHPNISEDKLREHVRVCVRLSDPGPHVFLLVLQPEDFTEEVKLRLCRVLKLFSDRSFDHSLVLISTPREESPGFMDKYMNHPPLKDMIRKCHYRFLWRKNLELPELLTRLGQIVRENNEQHLSLPEEPDVPHMMYSSIISSTSSTRSGSSGYSSTRSGYSDDEFLLSDLPDVKPERHSQNSLGVLPPDMSELRVVLLGNSWSQSSSVGNFILGETKFNTEEEPDCCQRERGQLKEKEIVLINTPDLLLPSILQHRLRRPVENCVRLSDPGPHVFLLVLQPEDFTEEVKLRLCRVLKLFSDRSFDHSLVLMSTPREESPGFMDKYMNHPPLKDMIRKCHYRFLWRKNLELPELLTRLGQIVRENNEKHLSLPREPDVPHMIHSSSSSISSSGCSSYNDEEFLLSSKFTLLSCEKEHLAH